MPHGTTDPLGYNAEENRTHVNDLHATLLHLLGIDHEKLTYRFQGRDFRLTDVHGKLIAGVGNFISETLIPAQRVHGDAGGDAGV